MKKGQALNFCNKDGEKLFFVGMDPQFKDCVKVATDINNKNTYARYLKSTFYSLVYPAQILANCLIVSIPSNEKSTDIEKYYINNLLEQGFSEYPDYINGFYFDYIKRHAAGTAENNENIIFFVA